MQSKKGIEKKEKGDLIQVSGVRCQVSGRSFQVSGFRNENSNCFRPAMIHAFDIVTG
jgi:hypothetical protein